MQEKLLEAVKKAKQGDRQAAADLYSLTERAVYFTALKIVGDDDEAKDIAQDTYIRVFTELDNLHSDKAFISWIKSIVVNLCKDHMKRRRPVLFADDEEEMRMMASIPEVSEDFLPEEYAERREKSRLVMKIVDSLPETQRMTVILYYYDGMSVSDVAKVMEVSEGTVKSRLNYARKQIKDKVEKLDEEGTKLYAIPVLLLSRILQNASLDYSLPQGVADTILAESLKAAPGFQTAPAAPQPAVSAGGTSGAPAGRIGGFASLNSGEIVDCYSISNLRTRKAVSGGFAGENTGNISQSFCSGSVRGALGGVSGSGKGGIDSAWFFNNESEKKLGKLRDKELLKRSDAIKTAQGAEKLGFDTTRIWEHISGSNMLHFRPEAWFYETGVAAGAIVIKTAEDLINLARGVNGGDGGLASADIRLGCDIDLGGKEWDPIGNELAKSFSGRFDGCGHTVKNFVIKSKNVKAKGFFGYLKGEVYNLTVKCRISDKTGGVAGGIAAHCDKGVIGCCAAVVAIRCGKGSFGGLVGTNTGKIFHSCAAGAISSFKIPWYLLLPLIPMLLLTARLLFPAGLPDQATPDSLQVFAPVPQDINIQPIPGASAPQASGGNFVSIQFNQLVDINTTTGECLLNYMNPSTSNHDVVVQIQITDAQAVSIMGSTGRTAEEQQKLDDNPKYDPENYRVQIAESGAVPPGYLLDTLQLTKHQNGDVLPAGEYSATVYLVFYDVITHNRAMLETQLPVNINVHE